MNDYIRQLILYDYGDETGPLITQVFESTCRLAVEWGGADIVDWLRKRAAGRDLRPLDLSGELGVHVRNLMACVPEMRELFSIQTGNFLDFRSDVSIDLQKEIEDFAIQHPHNPYEFNDL